MTKELETKISRTDKKRKNKELKNQAQASEVRERERDSHLDKQQGGKVPIEEECVGGADWRIVVAKPLTTILSILFPVFAVCVHVCVCVCVCTQ